MQFDHFPRGRDLALVPRLLVGLQHAREARLAGETLGALRVRVGDAESLQLVQQIARRVVAGDDTVDIQHRFAQAGRERGIAEIVDVEECTDVRMRAAQRSSVASA